MQRLCWGFALVVLVVCCGAISSVPELVVAPPAPPAFGVSAVRVVDGDTLEAVRGDDVDRKAVRLRLFDVDCPELSETNGDFARKVAAETVGAQPVWVFPSGRRATDRYGRVLVRVWTEKGWLSDALLRVGAARRYIDPDNPAAGLVGKTTGAVPPPSVPGQPPAVTRPERKPSVGAEDPTVYITRTGAKYHRAGCRYLSKSMIPTKLSEAKSRYGPCSVCNPPQ